MYLRVYKWRKSAIAVTLRIYANCVPIFYSMVKVKFVHDNLWLEKIKFRKKFLDIHRSVGLLNSKNGL